MIRRRKGVVMAVVALLLASVSGNALAGSVSALEFVRWNAVPLTEDELAGITGEGWQAAAAAVLSAIGGLIVGWEAERMGLRDAYMELRDNMEGVGELLREYEQYNPRANLETTCPRCDAIAAATQR